MSASLKILKSLDVLYADDDTVLLEALSSVLTGHFRSVITATNGQETLEKYQKRKPDVVMLDIRMPKKDGLSVAQEIREHSSDTPIIILSSFCEREDLLKSVKLNLIDFLIKPVELTTLRSTLELCATRISNNAHTGLRLTDTVLYFPQGATLDTPEGHISLTRNEKVFLDLLLQSRGKLVSIDTIEEVVFDDNMSLPALRNLVLRLRKKIGKQTIISFKEMGYLIR
ncbi:response regulator transcription factor [Chrysiogenes arsenatis]|uniref:response regulator transcription factor n=1 Tax=Chrysiogenes arsenatis TaxID=309797 RepID=UPI000420C3C5|nr:response regulator transcription factor [Chrysiogenes arsenatis]